MFMYWIWLRGGTFTINAWFTSVSIAIERNCFFVWQTVWSISWEFPCFRTFTVYADFTIFYSLHTSSTSNLSYRIVYRLFSDLLQGEIFGSDAHFRLCVLFELIEANLVNSTLENRIVLSHRTIDNNPNAMNVGAELCDELCLIEKKDEYMQVSLRLLCLIHHKACQVLSPAD